MQTGLPQVNIVFRTAGITAIQRSQKGIVAMILKDAAALYGMVLENVTEIPEVLSPGNQKQVELAFLGYVNPPRRVLLYVYDETDATLDDALDYFATQSFDYLAAPPELEADDLQRIASWVKSERVNDHAVKAVLPKLAADSEAIVNFTGTGIACGEITYSTAEYCSRIAGLIAGTPMTIACTYAPLPEVSDIKKLPKRDLDTAIQKGELVLYHDGEKVKTGRGVNSLVTTTQDKGDAFQKIKIVEAVDMIKTDIRKTAEDSYIGKYANSYDNKLLLIMAIKGYFEELERGGILEKGTSVVEINTEAQRIYLLSKGTDPSKMTEQEIKEAGTGSQVFLKAKLQILDAIEDIDLDIAI